MVLILVNLFSLCLLGFLHEAVQINILKKSAEIGVKTMKISVLFFFSFIMDDGSHAQTFPTSQPTMHPSNQPTIQPSNQPTIQPSQQPSRQPSNRPTIFNTNPKAKIPTGQPSRLPSSQPFNRPSRQPVSFPTVQPTRQPSRRPTCRPTSEPRSFPSSRPTMYVASPPKPTNGDITLAMAVVQTTTTLSGITATQVTHPPCSCSLIPTLALMQKSHTCFLAVFSLLLLLLLLLLLSLWLLLQNQSLAFAQGFSAALARAVDPLTTGAADVVIVR